MRFMSVAGNVILRSEFPEDIAAIHFVNQQAFGRRDEADLVDALRSEGAVLGSFVALLDEEIVGHVLFSRMSIEAANSVPAVALAPATVLPRHQRAGIGARLIRHGLERLRTDGERIVLVLGEPEYYGRFGFSAEMARDLATPFPAEAYMALELRRVWPLSAILRQQKGSRVGTLFSSFR
jgi:putative acetyltransferase